MNYLYQNYKNKTNFQSFIENILKFTSHRRFRIIFHNEKICIIIINYMFIRKTLLNCALCTLN